jgi:hypothetical protein
VAEIDSIAEAMRNMANDYRGRSRQKNSNFHHRRP